MKNAFIFSLIALIYTLPATAQLGHRSPGEKQIILDEVTGLPIIVLTSPEKNDKALYQTDLMWTSDGQYILFRSSSRTGEKGYDEVLPDGTTRRVSPRQQLYLLHETSGEIIQITEGNDLNSYQLAHATNRLFLTREKEGEVSMFILNLDQLLQDSEQGTVQGRERYEKYVGTFPREWGKAGGFAVDCMDDYAYISVSREPILTEVKEAKKKQKYEPREDQPVKVKPGYGSVCKMNLSTGKVEKIVDTDFRIGHIQTSLFTPGEIVFCHETGGDAPQRMWFLTADGSVFKPLYKETPLDWVTHETFATKDYVYFNILGWQDRLRKQVNGIARINLRTDDVELIGQVEMDQDRQAMDGMLVGRGFWHCNASRDGKWVAGDTFAGNIWLINGETGEKHLLVTDTKMKPDHAHPYFSPDGKKILFQSGRMTNGERLQLMMVHIPSWW